MPRNNDDGYADDGLVDSPVWSRTGGLDDEDEDGENGSAGGADAGANGSNENESNVASADAPKKFARGGVPPAPSYDGEISTDSNSFRKYGRRVDIWVSQVKHILPAVEHAPRLLANLKDDAFDATEDYPVNIFEVESGVQVLMKLLEPHFAPRPQVKLKKAVQDFFENQNVAQGESTQHAVLKSSKSYRRLKEEKVLLPEELRVLFFLEGTGLSEVQQANLITAAGGDYKWDKIVDMLQTMYPSKLPGLRTDAHRLSVKTLAHGNHGGKRESFREKSEYRKLIKRTKPGSTMSTYPRRSRRTVGRNRLTRKMRSSKYLKESDRIPRSPPRLLPRSMQRSPLTGRPDIA